MLNCSLSLGNFIMYHKFFWADFHKYSPCVADQVIFIIPFAWILIWDCNYTAVYCGLGCKADRACGPTKGTEIVTNISVSWSISPDLHVVYFWGYLVCVINQLFPILYWSYFLSVWNTVNIVQDLRFSQWCWRRFKHLGYDTVSLVNIY